MLNELALRVLVALKGVSGKFQDEDGQTLAEYGLILAVISVFVIGGAAVLLRGSIESAFNTASGCLDGSC
jgi:Flp pilus assembly pilin Flp